MNAEASLLDWRFIGLLVLIALGRVVIPARFYPLYGLIASGLLLCWASLSTALIIGAVTLFYLYPLHLLMCGAATPRARRGVFLAGIAGLVALLIGFKVHRQFELPIVAGALVHSGLAGLVGFSYFIFKALQFLHLKHLVAVPEKNPVTLLYFTFFPPTLSSGPIQKFQDFQNQVGNPAPLTWSLAGEAVYRITRGYFRKLALAYPLSLAVTSLMAGSHYTVWISLGLIVVFYLYLYFDFAGYSDIAIGFGLLLGIRVPENFRKPFGATTVAEFWRNWHITLVDWFRDQVFVPLGGRHASKYKGAFLSMVVMVLCGFWHGLAWNFVLWGLWHGSLLAFEALCGVRTMPPSERHGWRYAGRVVLTNAKIALGALLFLPDPAEISAILTGFTRW